MIAVEAGVGVVLPWPIKSLLFPQGRRQHGRRRHGAPVPPEPDREHTPYVCKAVLHERPTDFGRGVLPASVCGGAALPQGLRRGESRCEGGGGVYCCDPTHAVLVFERDGGRAWQVGVEVCTCATGAIHPPPPGLSP